ncbi:uncharacterized protein METZ01_LOCUS189685 [marine metagenome]|uniref:Bacteriophage SP-beta YorD domain-containing protein n=1 Tax=marine metagenome TaxID=408172 RepID=A0A382DGM1_9ZZZZ
MATLVEIIKEVHSSLSNSDFNYFSDGTILLQNDLDGNGDYIAKWEHPSLSKPTADQLKAAEDALG